MKIRHFAVFICIGIALTTTAYSQGNSQKTLKEVYSGKFLIGIANDLSGLSGAELSGIKQQYDIVTPENCMKPQPVHPAEDKYNFGIADALVDWCKQNGLKVWGHTLVWHSQTAPWFFKYENPELSNTENSALQDSKAKRPGDTGFCFKNRKDSLNYRKTVLQRLEKHIKTEVGRYKGSVIGWDVVNESIADGGSSSTENLRNYSWYKVIGPDVIALAFRWAHEANPKAKLYYNDYNIEQGAVENKGKHASSLLLLKRLLAEKVPITGVGIQGHWDLNVNLADIEKAIENYASLGLRVSITELDVTSIGENSGNLQVQQGKSTQPKNYEKQAEVYKRLFEIFKRHANVIDRVTFWGLNDSRSWRRGQDALLFDGQQNPKPAFHAVIEAGLN
jgi:endo-1,4-beta-xylanase